VFLQTFVTNFKYTATLTQSKPLVETIVINRETNINSPPRKKIKKGPNKNSNKQSKKDATKNNKKNQKKNLRKQQNRKTTQEQQQKAKLEAEQEISLEEQGKYLALDCEMVGVGEGGVTSALARVSIVDYNNAILLDTHVKVDEPVTDYRTFVSGIREEHLQSDTAMDFAQCQSIVKKILKDKILVGHALRNDLGVLDLEHPWYNCRDTAKYEPFMKKDKNSDILKPKKLKVLAETKLNRIIQRVGEEHCPIEDATAALDLYKKARVKWEKAVEYKMSRTKAIAHDL
jgi:RNA exonuclease 4